MDTKNVRTRLLIGQLSKVFTNKCAVDLKDIRDLHPKKVLVIAPHADDEVIGCGAAIEHFVQKGVEVCVLIVTQESDRSIAKSYQYIPEQRVEESYEAKSILGYHELLYFDFPELKLPNDRALQDRYCEELAALIETRRPDCIFIPNVNEMHPDHRIIGQLSLLAISESINEQRLRRPAMVIYEIWGPVRMNSYLEISEEAYSKKIRSIHCYKSQMCSVDYEQIIRFIGNSRGSDLRQTGGKREHIAATMAEAYELHGVNDF